MKTNEVKILLNKFYNGQTTMDEELMLRSYFESEDVSLDLITEKEPFLRLSDVEELTIPSTLESKLEDLIDGLTRQEATEMKVKQTKKRNLWFGTISIAAGIALLISAGIYLNNETVSNTNTTEKDIKYTLKDTYSDPETARVEAEKALLLMAANLNKGMERLTLVPTNMGRTSEIVEKSLNKINN